MSEFFPRESKGAGGFYVAQPTTEFCAFDFFGRKGSVDTPSLIGRAPKVKERLILAQISLSTVETFALGSRIRVLLLRNLS